MEKERDSNHAETFKTRQEEIRRLTDELQHLQGLYEQGQISEEQFFLKRGPLVRRRLGLTDLVRKEKFNAVQHRDWLLSKKIDAQRLAEIEDDISRLPKKEREALRQKLKDEIEKIAPPSQRGNREELYQRLETWAKPTEEWEKVTREYKKSVRDDVEIERAEERGDEDKQDYVRVEQDDSHGERYDELADAIVELMGTDPKREDPFEKLTAWVDEYEDVRPEWMYWRILRYLHDAPIIEEVHESTRGLLRDTATFFQRWSRNIDRRKGKRKLRGEYSAKDYPKLEFQYVDEYGDDVRGQFEAPGIVITPDDEGNPIQRVPGYGPGVPLERDKLEDELLIELFGFLLRKGFPPKDAYYLLQDIFLAFLGRPLSWRTIQTRILPHATD